YALRSIRKNPLLSGIVIVSLGLGIGANTPIFSLLDQLLLRLLPVENPHQLVQLATRGALFGASWGRGPDVLSDVSGISRFSRDRSIVGRTIYLNSQPMTVVGLSAPGFRGIEIGDATQVFVPMMMLRPMNPIMGQFSDLENRRSQWVGVFARLKPGVTM